MKRMKCANCGYWKGARESLLESGLQIFKSVLKPQTSG